MLSSHDVRGLAVQRSPLPTVPYPLSSTVIGSVSLRRLPFDKITGKQKLSERRNKQDKLTTKRSGWLRGNAMQLIAKWKWRQCDLRL